MTKKRPSTDRYSQRFWEALVGLEEAVDDLSTRILARAAPPPETTNAQASSAHKTESGDDPEDSSDLYIQRMAKMQRTVSILRDCIDAPARDLPAPAKRRNLKRIVHPAIEATADTAKRARIGRAARRYGLSFKEWVRRYGFVDRHPHRP